MKGPDGEIKRIQIERTSSLIPSQDGDGLLRTLFLGDFQIEFNQAPVDPSTYSAVGYSSRGADLRFRIFPTFYDTLPSSKLQLEYDVETEKVFLEAFAIECNSRHWGSNGKLVSIPDLLDAQMIVRMGHSLATRPEEDNKILQSLIKRIELESLVLKIGNGREFWFRAGDFERHFDDEGYPFYVRTKMARSDSESVPSLH